jgi:hypothetical protein
LGKASEELVWELLAKRGRTVAAYRDDTGVWQYARKQGVDPGQRKHKRESVRMLLDSQRLKGG